jgi:hypothetical protein
MLRTEAAGQSLELLDEGYTFPSITEETRITTEDAEAVHIAWFKGTTEQLFREVQLAGVPEASATRLRTGQGWDESTTGDVLGEILHVYSKSRSRRVTDSIQRKRKQVWGRRREPRLLTMRNTHPGKRTGRGQRMLAEAISPPIQISEEL